MREPIRVAVVDAVEGHRTLISDCIARSRTELRVVAVWTGTPVLEVWAASQRPHVLLLDDEALLEQGLDHTLRLLRATLPHIAVIVRSPVRFIGYIQHLLNQGVKGYLSRQDAPEATLVPAIRAVHSGQVYLSAGLLPYQQRGDGRLQQLTLRDFEVLRLLARGLTVQGIAEMLHLTPWMVYRSRNKLKDLLGVTTNEQMILLARDKGLI